MGYVLKLERLRKTDRIAGKKACSLGELIRAGYPVPPGFVITAEAYVKFLKTNNLETKIKKMLSEIKLDDISHIETVSDDIQNLIINADIPEFIAKDIKEAYDELSVGKDVKGLGGIAFDMIKAGRGSENVSVRPSPVSETDKTFFGHTTLLNVSGFGKLTDAVKEVWASVFSKNALLYRGMRNIERPLMSVIVQKMLEPEKSGILSTADPVSGDSSKIVIESVWGLCKTLNKGLLIPDLYYVSKETGNIEKAKTGKKPFLMKRDPVSGSTVTETVFKEKTNVPSLNENEVKKLWELSRKIEDCFGSQQVIVWCIERNRIFVLNALPLKIASAQDIPEPEKGELIVQGVPSSPGIAVGKIKTVSETKGCFESDAVVVTKNASDEIIDVIKNVSGVITESGGVFSNGAFLCREFGIPMITGAENITNFLKEDQMVLINGLHGAVYRTAYSGREEGIDANEHEQQQKVTVFNEALKKADPGITATEIKIILNGSSVSPETLEKSDGVGLFEPEYMLTESDVNPYEIAQREPEEIIGKIANRVGEVARRIYPKPVWYKGFDLRTDEIKGLEETEEETNPLIGWHGIAKGLEEANLLKCEIEAVKRMYESGLANVSYLVPFMRRVEELRRLKLFMDFPLKLGVMIETPSVALNIEEFCKEGINFVCINLNTLTQLTLGVDKNVLNLSPVYLRFDPSVKELVKKVVKISNKYGIEVSAAGDVLSLPEAVEKLVELGVKSITVKPDIIEKTKSAVVRTEKRLLLSRIRESEF